MKICLRPTARAEAPLRSLTLQCNGPASSPAFRLHSQPVRRAGGAARGREGLSCQGLGQITSSCNGPVPGPSRCTVQRDRRPIRTGRGCTPPPAEPGRGRLPIRSRLTVIWPSSRGRLRPPEGRGGTREIHQEKHSLWARLTSPGREGCAAPAYGYGAGRVMDSSERGRHARVEGHSKGASHLGGFQKFASGKGRKDSSQGPPGGFCRFPGRR